MSKINELVSKIGNGQNPLFHELYGTDSAVLKAEAERYIAQM